MECLLSGSVQPGGQEIQQDASVLDVIQRTLQHTLFCKAVQLLAAELERFLHALLHGRLHHGKLFQQLLPVRHGKLGGVAGRCGTKIRDIIGDRHIRLMADSGNDRDL